MIKRITEILLITFFFLYPLFYINVTGDTTEFPKLILLVTITILLAFLSSLSVVFNKKIILSKSAYSVPLLILTLLTILSTVFQSPNIFISLTSPLSGTTVIFSFLLYLFVTNNISKEQKNVYFGIIVLSATIISLYVILIYLGILPRSLILPSGNLVSTAIFLSIISFYLCSRLITNKFSANSPGIFIFLKNHFLILLSATFSTISALMLTFHLSTDQKAVILPYSIGLSVLSQVFANPKSLFLGVGPANFLTAYTLGKPAIINQTPFWNLIFTSSSSFILTLSAEVGSISIIVFLWILIRLLLQSLKLSEIKTHPFALTALFTLILLILFPASQTVFITFIILLGFSAQKLAVKNIYLSKLKYFLFIVPLTSVMLSIGIFYLVGRILLAEVYYKIGNDRLNQNQLALAYDYQKKALFFNPLVDRYHLSFSQTSLLSANALAAKKEPIDEEKQAILSLSQQAIDEARFAVSLYKTNVVNWENLTKTYSSLKDFAVGSQDWAIEAAQKTITLDPHNPNYYITLGLLYTDQKDYINSEKYFKKAISLKSDLANAHFNYGLMLKEQKRFTEAKEEFTKTLQLLPTGSPDYQKVEKELQSLQL